MEPIYLEPDEEITSVIDKLSTSGSGKVAIVVPKNSTLFQSLVNLKLLAKQAKETNKHVVIITGNKVGQRLASQVGLEAFASLGTVKASPGPGPISQPVVPPEETLPDGTPVRRYTPPPSAAASQEETPLEEPSPPVIPAVPTPETNIATETTDESEKAGEVVTAAEAVEVSPPHEPIPPRAALSAEELPAIISRTPAAHREFHWEIPWKSIIAAVILLLLAFGITYILLPKATVTVTLPAKAVSQTLTLNAKTTPDAEETTIAGNLLAVEKTPTKSVAATGKKDIGTKSTGTVPFKNCEDTDTHVVAAGTKISASGKSFTTNAAATIPAGSFSGGGSVCNSSTAPISLTAGEAGEAFNLTNATFTISGLSTRISGSGSTSGGTTKQVTVLTQDDVNKAYADLEKQVLDEATADLKTKAEKQTLLDGSLNQTIKERSIDKKVGDQVDSATAKIVAQTAVIVFDRALAEAKLRQALEHQLDANQRLEIPDNALPTLNYKSYSDDKTVLMFEISGNGFGVPNVNKSDIAKAIRHKSKTSAVTTLKQTYQAEDVAISLTPSWWLARLPILSQAIRVEYGFHEAANPSAPVGQ